MARLEFTIESILGGHAETFYFGSGGTYHAAVGIDPDLILDDTRASGVLSPSKYEKITDSDLDHAPMWIEPNPQTGNTLVYTYGGSLYSFDEDFSMRTEDEATTAFPISLSNAKGNGLKYYNDYYYIFKDNDVDRYGPMSDPSNIAISSDWWTGNTLIKTEVFKIIAAETTINIGNTSSAATYDALAESVTESTDLIFNKVVMGMANAGTVGDMTGATITVAVHEDNSNAPGDIIDSDTKSGSEIVNGGDKDYEFDIDGVFEANTKYWVSIKVTGAGTNGYLTVWKSNDVDVYSDGIMKQSQDAGSTWLTNEVGRDLCFKLERHKTVGSSLGDATYPILDQNANVRLPNHTPHVHSDGSLYFADFHGDKGVLHRIKTGDTLTFRGGGSASAFKTGGGSVPTEGFKPGDVVTGKTSKATGVVVYAENPTLGTGSFSSTKYLGKLVLINISGTFEDDEDIEGSVSGTLAKAEGTVEFGKTPYAAQATVLDLPSGYRIVDIDSFGTDLAVLATQSIKPEIEQGKSKLFLWDTFSDSFYRDVSVPLNYVTSVKNHNGELLVFGGSIRENNRRKTSVYRYGGGDSVEPVFTIGNGQPPLAGAVDTDYNRLVWGSQTLDPIEYPNVFAFGMRDGTIRPGVHSIVAVPATGELSNAYTTAIRAMANQLPNEQRVIVGWMRTDDATGDSTAEYALAKGVATTSASVATLISNYFNIGRKFKVVQVTIPLADAVDTNTDITVTILADKEDKSKELAKINNTNYSGERIINLPVQLSGDTDFRVKIEWNGGPAIILPITFVVDVHDQK